VVGSFYIYILAKTGRVLCTGYPEVVGFVRRESEAGLVRRQAATFGYNYSVTLFARHQHSLLNFKALTRKHKIAAFKYITKITRAKFLTRGQLANNNTIKPHNLIILKDDIKSHSLGFK
jgi:hypothetical protein